MRMSDVTAASTMNWLHAVMKSINADYTASLSTIWTGTVAVPSVSSANRPLPKYLRRCILMVGGRLCCSAVESPREWCLAEDRELSLIANLNLVGLEGLKDPTIVSQHSRRLSIVSVRRRVDNAAA